MKDNGAFVLTALLFLPAAGLAYAQLAGGNATSDISRRNVSGALPTAPGNPHMSTVVPDNAPTMKSPYLRDTWTFNSIMPSSGKASTTEEIPGSFSAAPKDMSLSQFTTYVRGRWGINSANTITKSEWNNVDPAFFGNSKPSFSSLDINRNGFLDEGELQPSYTRLYGKYKNPSEELPGSVR